MDDFNLGELFIVGFHGTKLDNRIHDYFSEFLWGGLILFSRNITDFNNWKNLTQSMQIIRREQNKPPYFIALDEEGGTVSRMPDDSFTLPGARSLSETHNLNLIFEAGKTTGNILKFYGCNLNFAPVLDINVNPLNPGIGIRSFGTTKEDAASYGLKFMDGLNSADILSCAKHFPGKGDITKDSHKTSAVCHTQKEQIFSVHLYPFRQAVSKNIPFIMTSHATYPAVDDKPATVSKIFLTDILRNSMGFNGLIISDDLEMGAMSSWHANIGETAYKAIMAGCDILLVCHSEEKQKEAYSYLLEKLNHDKKLYSRCVQSYNRIIRMKKLLSTGFSKNFNLSRIPELSKKIAGKSVKIIRDKTKKMPLNKSFYNKKILLAGSKFRSDIEVEMIRRTPYGIIDLYKKFQNIHIIEWGLNPEIFSSDFGSYDLIFLCTNNACIYDGQKKLINSILDKYAKKIILIAIKNPEDIDYFTQAQTAIAVYGYNKSNITALEQILTG